MSEPRPFPWTKWVLLVSIALASIGGVFTLWNMRAQPELTGAVGAGVSQLLGVLAAIACGGVVLWLSRWVFERVEQAYAQQQAEAEQKAQRAAARKALAEAALPVAVEFTRDLFGGVDFCHNPRHPEACYLAVEMSVLRYYDSALQQLQRLTNELNYAIVNDHNRRNPKTIEGHREHGAAYLCDLAESLLANDNLLAVARKHPRLHRIIADGEELARLAIRAIFDRLNVPMPLEEEAKQKAEEVMQEAANQTEATLLTISKLQARVEESRVALVEDAHGLSRTLRDEETGCAALFEQPEKPCEAVPS